MIFNPQAQIANQNMLQKVDNLDISKSKWDKNAPVAVNLLREEHILLLIVCLCWQNLFINNEPFIWRRKEILLLTDQ